MDIVYLIGNGFDRNLNLNTDYKSFYQYYIAQASYSPVIKQLKSIIKSDYENWADLEEALGKYLKNLTRKEDAISIHKDLLNHLQTYICKEEARFVPPKNSSSEILKELFYPIKSLRKNQRKKLENSILKTEQLRDLYIITFNYTQTIEKLIDYKGEPIIASTFRGGYYSRLLDIEHIHGFCDPDKGRMALGLDNPTQICNETLSKSQNICYRFVKPTFNDLTGEEHHLKCLQWIKRADFICIFGMSIGISDQTWWDAIGKRLLTSNAILLYFYHEGFELHNNNTPEFQEQVDSVKDWLLPKLGIDDISNENIRNRIFISCDKSMFKYGIPEKYIDEPDHLYLQRMSHNISY